jgi:tetratricopeptide (TPR) repeat protein
VRELEKLIAVDHTNVEAARKLGALATDAKDDRLAALAFARVASLDPFDAAAHSAWGRLALAQRDTATAVREFRVALATGPSDKAAAYCDLGESYLQAGKPTEAKQQALAALEIAPTYARAQELLLNAIGGHP